MDTPESKIANLYVCFWRWATWKVFDAHDDAPFGVVALITPKCVEEIPDDPEAMVEKPEYAPVTQDLWIGVDGPARFLARSESTRCPG